MSNNARHVGLLDTIFRAIYYLGDICEIGNHRKQNRFYYGFYATLQFKKCNKHSKDNNKIRENVCFLKLLIIITEIQNLKWIIAGSKHGHFNNLSKVF